MKDINRADITPRFTWKLVVGTVRTRRTCVDKCRFQSLFFASLYWNWQNNLYTILDFYSRFWVGLSVKKVNDHFEFVYDGQQIRVVILSVMCYCCHWVSCAGVVTDHAAAKKSFDAAVRCVFGTEAVHVSLLYFMTYISAAGGLGPILSTREKFGGQEFRVVVSA